MAIFYYLSLKLKLKHLIIWKKEWQKFVKYAGRNPSAGITLVTHIIKHAADGYPTSKTSVLKSRAKLFA